MCNNNGTYSTTEWLMQSWLDMEKKRSEITNIFSTKFDFEKFICAWMDLVRHDRRKAISHWGALTTRRDKPWTKHVPQCLATYF